MEAIFFQKLLPSFFRENLTEELFCFDLWSNDGLIWFGISIEHAPPILDGHQPPRTAGISSVSILGSNFLMNLFRPSVMSTAKNPCCILVLNSFSISRKRSGLSVSVSHSASVSSPAAESIRNFLTPMVTPVGLAHRIVNARSIVRQGNFENGTNVLRLFRLPAGALSCQSKDHLQQ